MPTSFSAELLLLLRVAAAGVCSAVVGYERESKGKAAGLRTHMLVGMSAALYSVTAVLLAQTMESRGGALSYDPIRLVQSIATGVGFLGAGTIFLTGREHRVHGLTTAASIWATAAIGLTIGVGWFVLGAGATLLFLLVLAVLARFDTAEKERDALEEKREAP